MQCDVRGLSLRGDFLIGAEGWAGRVEGTSSVIFPDHHYKLLPGIKYRPEQNQGKA